MSTTLGKLVKVDEPTLKKTSGYYASVLVEIDFSKPVDKTVYVQSSWDPEGYEQVVLIPKEPEYCDHCNVLGHNINQSNAKLRSASEKRDITNNVARGRKNDNTNRVYATPIEGVVHNNRNLLQGRTQTLLNNGKNKHIRWGDDDTESSTQVNTGMFNALKNNEQMETDGTNEDKEDNNYEKKKDCEDVYDETTTVGKI